MAKDALQLVANGLLLGQDPRCITLVDPGAQLTSSAFSPVNEESSARQPATTSGASRSSGPTQSVVVVTRPLSGRAQRPAGRCVAQRRSKRSTGCTKTVAPPTSTSTGYGM